MSAGLTAGFHTVDTLLWVFLLAFGGGLYFVFQSAKQAPDNPLRIALGALATRLIVTLGLGAIDVPATIAVTPVGLALDAASILFLFYYYFTGARQMLTAFSPPKSLPPPV